jgi:propionyl-CoA synthetase
MSVQTAKYGSTFGACPGYDLVALDDSNQPVPPGKLGGLAIRLPLPPGTLLTLYNADERFSQAYMTKRPGYYDTGDNGYIDSDGYVFVLSRADDVINVAGHRLSTGSMEEILSEHEDIAECAVIGVKCPLKGQVPVGLFVLYDSSANKNHEEVIGTATDMIR